MPRSRRLSIDEKERLVGFAISGALSTAEVARQCGHALSKVERWVSRYRLYGRFGLDNPDRFEPPGRWR